MPSNPVDWFEIYVQDMERAKRFYEAVLQTELERLNSPAIEMWGFPMSMEHTGASGGDASAVADYVRVPGAACMPAAR